MSQAHKKSRHYFWMDLDLKLLSVRTANISAGKICCMVISGQSGKYLSKNFSDMQGLLLPRATWFRSEEKHNWVSSKNFMLILLRAQFFIVCRESAVCYDLIKRKQSMVMQVNQQFEKQNCKQNVWLPRHSFFSIKTNSFRPRPLYAQALFLACHCNCTSDLSKKIWSDYNNDEKKCKRSAVAEIQSAAEWLASWEP